MDPADDQNISPEVIHQEKNETARVRHTNKINLYIALIGILGSIITSILFHFLTKPDINEEVRNALPTVIQSGTSELHANQMDTTFGEKTIVIKDIKFHPAFDAPPKVVVGIRGFHFKSGDVSIVAYPQNITKEGFDLVFQKWGNSRVYYSDVDWVAFQN